MPDKPDWKREISKRLADLNLPPEREIDIVDELSLHMEDCYQEFLHSGATEEEAGRKAFECFDDDLLKRKLRDHEKPSAAELYYPSTNGRNFMESLWWDLRYGIRVLTKNPGFTAVAVITLTLAIGATSSIFSVVNAVLLKQLPFKDPDRLVLLWGTTRSGKQRQQISYTDLQDWRSQSKSFEEVVAFSGNYSPILSGNGKPERVPTMQVSEGYFQLMQTPPLLGRFFLAEDFKNRDEHLAVLSYELWQSRFGKDPAIVGKAIQLDANSYVVLGVMPADFHSLPTSLVRHPAQLYVPLPNETAEYNDTQRSWTWLRSIARLKSGSSIEQAQAELDAIAAEQERRYPDTNAGRGVRVVALKTDFVKDIKTTLVVLQSVVFLVVLIACVNLANLLLARLNSRSKEFAIRMSLGASRSRFARQMLTEGLLLSFGGGVFGLLLTVWGIAVLENVGAKVLPELSDIRIDVRVLAFTAGLSLVIGLFYGIASTMRVSTQNLTAQLKESGRAAGWFGSRKRINNLLVVAEIALSFVLLVGAGLLIRSFLNLQRVNPGFDPRNTLSVQVSLPDAKYPGQQSRASFFNKVIEQIQQLPGVQYAGAVSILPESGNFDHVPVEVVGRTYKPGERPVPDAYRITPDYFKALSIPLLKGRFFTDKDDVNHPTVALINETMAAQLWPGEDPVGKRIWSGFGGTTRTIVGVVGDVYQYGLDSEKTMQLYVRYAENATGTMTLVVRSAVDPVGLTSAIQSEVLSIDKDQPIYNAETMDQVLADSFAGRRFSMDLLMVFAATALTLAVIGIYGVVSYSVSQRIREFGIRLALGAQRRDVLGLVIKQGTMSIVAGVAVGSIAAYGLTRFIRELLFGVAPADPVTFVAIPLVLFIAGLSACYIPARRATKADPMIALRSE